MSSALAAIDMQDFSSDECGRLKIEDCVDDLRDFAHTPDGMKAAKRFVRLDRMHRRFDDAWRDRVHPDSAACIFDGKGPGDGVEAALAQRGKRRWQGRDWLRDEAGRDLHDMAFATLLHFGGRELRDVKETGDVNARRFVKWAAEEFRWPDYEAEKLFAVNKTLNEPDFPPLAIMHDLMIGARLLRHYKGKAVLAKAGRAMVGDYGALQAEMFDAFFIALDHTAYERFPIDYDDADIRHFLSIVHNRLGDWVPLTELAGWCLPIDLIRTYRFSPQSDACFYLLSRLIRPLLWLGLIEQKPREDRMRIEGRRYRKTPLCNRLLGFKAVRDGGRTIH